MSVRTVLVKTVSGARHGLFLITVQRGNNGISLQKREQMNPDGARIYSAIVPSFLIPEELLPVRMNELTGMYALYDFMLSYAFDGVLYVWSGVDRELYKDYVVTIMMKDDLPVIAFCGEKHKSEEDEKREALNVMLREKHPTPATYPMSSFIRLDRNSNPMVIIPDNDVVHEVDELIDSLVATSDVIEVKAKSVAFHGDIRMSYRTGDKIWFLGEYGGGYVTSSLRSGIVIKPNVTPYYTVIFGGRYENVERKDLMEYSTELDDSGDPREPETYGMTYKVTSYTVKAYDNDFLVSVQGPNAWNGIMRYGVRYVSRVQKIDQEVGGQSIEIHVTPTQKSFERYDLTALNQADLSLALKLMKVNEALGDDAGEVFKSSKSVINAFTYHKVDPTGCNIMIMAIILHYLNVEVDLREVLSRKVYNTILDNSLIYDDKKQSDMIFNDTVENMARLLRNKKGQKSRRLIKAAVIACIRGLRVVSEKRDNQSHLKTLPLGGNYKLKIVMIEEIPLTQFVITAVNSYETVTMKFQGNKSLSRDLNENVTKIENIQGCSSVSELTRPMDGVNLIVTEFNSSGVRETFCLGNRSYTSKICDITKIKNAASLNGVVDIDIDKLFPNGGGQEYAAPFFTGMDRRRVRYYIDKAVNGKQYPICLTNSFNIADEYTIGEREGEIQIRGYGLFSYLSQVRIIRVGFKDEYYEMDKNLESFAIVLTDEVHAKYVSLTDDVRDVFERVPVSKSFIWVLYFKTRSEMLRRIPLYVEYKSKSGKVTSEYVRVSLGKRKLSEDLVRKAVNFDRALTSLNGYVEINKEPMMPMVYQRGDSIEICYDNNRDRFNTIDNTLVVIMGNMVRYLRHIYISKPFADGTRIPVLKINCKVNEDSSTLLQALQWHAQRMVRLRALLAESIYRDGDFIDVMTKWEKSHTDTGLGTIYASQSIPSEFKGFIKTSRTMDVFMWRHLLCDTRTLRSLRNENNTTKLMASDLRVRFCALKRIKTTVVFLYLYIMLVHEKKVPTGDGNSSNLIQYLGTFTKSREDYRNVIREVCGQVESIFNISTISTFINNNAFFDEIKKLLN